MSSRGSHTSGGYENGIAVEEAIVAQLKELDLVRRRNDHADREDLYELEQVYDEIVKNAIARDNDPVRKPKLEDLVEKSFNLRRLILHLRGWHPADAANNFYFDTAMHTLIKVTERTYDVEYRKAAIVLGIVEAGAELLVMEVRMWGPMASIDQKYVNGKGRNERREVRKQIASVLTNLTFGSASMKKFVAEYDGFMDVVIDIIENAPNLVPPYANLLRNVSWPSCKGMASLFRATPALTKAAIEAHHRVDDKSVKSTLSAIWNIVGSGGEECVRKVVEMEGCVMMLIELLVTDAQRTLVVEYSTGILKYASAELVRGEKLEHCSHLRHRLITRLLPLLRASSMTIVKNSLCAVSEIAAKDNLSVQTRMTPSAMESLERLQRSNDNDIRRPAKSILSRIGAADYGSGAMSRSAHVGNGRDMSCSVRCDRLLPRRSPYCSPAMGGGGGGGMANGIVPLSMDASSSSHRASSLPRHFNEEMRGGGGGMSSSMYGTAGGGGGQFMMGSPSPLYGNMDTIRAAQQQQQAQLQLQHTRQLQHLQQQQQQGPPSPFGGMAPLPIPRGFPVSASFVPPPPGSFPSTSFAPPPFATTAACAAAEGGQGGQQPFGANGPPTLQYEESEEREDNGEYYEDDEEEDELSTQVTRAGSMESLNEDGMSHDISGFHSNVETANNSCRLSPVSYSDLPDSPTQCAAIRDRENALQLNLPSFPIASSTMGGTSPFGMGPSSSSGTNGSSGGLSSSQTHSSHTTPHATSAEQTPTYSTLNAHYPPDYGRQI
uniref:Apr-1 n=1 Tax=Pristionchus pacificus TaxID=54126 RepID=Q5IWQ7_PRIPA|nr:apr-1 [Pristionchus pacificus]